MWRRGTLRAPCGARQHAPPGRPSGGHVGAQMLCERAAPLDSPKDHLLACTGAQNPASPRYSLAQRERAHPCAWGSTNTLKLESMHCLSPPAAVAAATGGCAVRCPFTRFRLLRAASREGKSSCGMSGRLAGAISLRTPPPKRSSTPRTFGLGTSTSSRPAPCTSMCGHRNVKPSFGQYPRTSMSAGMHERLRHFLSASRQTPGQHADLDTHGTCARTRTDAEKHLPHSLVAVQGTPCRPPACLQPRRCLCQPVHPPALASPPAAPPFPATPPHSRPSARTRPLPPARATTRRLRHRHRPLRGEDRLCGY